MQTGQQTRRQRAAVERSPCGRLFRHGERGEKQSACTERARLYLLTPRAGRQRYYRARNGATAMQKPVIRCRVLTKMDHMVFLAVLYTLFSIAHTAWKHK